MRGKLAQAEVMLAVQEGSQLLPGAAAAAIAAAVVIDAKQHKQQHIHNRTLQAHSHPDLPDCAVLAKQLIHLQERTGRRQNTAYSACEDMWDYATTASSKQTSGCGRIELVCDKLLQ